MTAVLPIDPLFTAAHRAFGAAWPAFRQEWGGLRSDEELFATDPDAVRGQTRLMDACYVAGLRHPHYFAVSADYVGTMRRYWRFVENFEDENVFAKALATIDATGHRAGWPFVSMTGRTFQWLVAGLMAKGYEVLSALDRDGLDAHELSYLRSLVRHVGLREDEMATVLCDFGGGVFRDDHLDRAGLARVEVAIEMRMAGYWHTGCARP